MLYTYIFILLYARVFYFLSRITHTRGARLQGDVTQKKQIRYNRTNCRSQYQTTVRDLTKIYIYVQRRISSFERAKHACVIKCISYKEKKRTENKDNNNKLSKRTKKKREKINNKKVKEQKKGWIKILIREKDCVLETKENREGRRSSYFNAKVTRNNADCFGERYFTQ